MEYKYLKKRTWTTIVYPDSAPSDWVEKLQITGLEVAISPLHDKDVDPDGNVKKAHYHVLLCYPGPTTINQVQELSSSCLSGVLVQPVESIRGAFRYLTHKDNPEKFQYNSSNIILLNGFDPTLTLSNSDESSIKREVIMYILDHNIYEYSDLINFLLNEENPDLYHVASNHTIFFNAYLHSRRYKLEKEKKVS